LPWSLLQLTEANSSKDDLSLVRQLISVLCGFNTRDYKCLWDVHTAHHRRWEELRRQHHPGYSHPRQEVEEEGRDVAVVRRVASSDQGCWWSRRQTRRGVAGPTWQVVLARSEEDRLGSFLLRALARPGQHRQLGTAAWSTSGNTWHWSSST
jgi:hypothetical protein